MKKYKKVKVISKNNPTGSYAAGCPSEGDKTQTMCRKCERSG